ncbi:hypothetical protein BHM03_00029831 [Ensete ventricosum]|nr:hypothetical protein BHM03_00029831 [Ensete ventricosum]
MLPSFPRCLRRGEDRGKKSPPREVLICGIVPRFSNHRRLRQSSYRLAVFARIASLAQKPDALRTGISPSDAALTLGIAPALAKEHLLTAESKGLIANL